MFVFFGCWVYEDLKHAVVWIKWLAIAKYVLTLSELLAGKSN
jgi:hypothetical protein